MRTLSYAFAVVRMLVNFANYLQAKRYNLELGVSDMMVLSIGSSMTYGADYALNNIPSIVLFQKMIPPNVEATLMAFAMSVINLSREIMGQMIGVAINRWFIGAS